MLQASLKVIGGKNDGKLIEFQSRKFLVGREQDCHLRPNSDLVSRHHCVFTLDDYTLRIRDLGSTNGTLVNGRRVRGETVLTPGDVVRIGKLNLEVVIGEAARAEAAPPIPNMETTTNASAVETAFALPGQTILDDSDSAGPAPSGDTAQFPVEEVPPTQDAGSDGELPIESDTSVTGSATDHTVADHPVAPQPVPAPYPPEAVPPGAWPYPPQYAQYPQYQQQFMPPPGYPMPYPPPYPGYGYPQQGQYPLDYQQQPASQPAQPASSNSLPEVRLPEPEDTGVKEQPKAPASSEAKDASSGSTPSQRAAELINSRRRRRTDDEK